ncbi:PAS domain-containing protein [Pseudidiomarina tainanensis]|uniref:PAS domain S-box-containing protein n=1 Tax=Pseudidiomarina tainanensis TaxID=502365 RepID=A0A368V5T5_9GAMM|nr:PAS domain-containing protein [Pseudidiomarina tainanensis]RCW34381.1 PAS domain S-box-containing protein [Pseudidiomarina tainanensis]
MPLPKNPYPDLTDAQVREQLQWLETIMTRSKVATWKLHRPSMKMFINSALAELLGQSWQREQSYPFELLLEAMHAECRHSAVAVMQQLWVGDLEHADVIFRVTAANGQVRTIRDTVSVISHELQGQAEWLTGVWIDITDTVMAIIAWSE